MDGIFSFTISDSYNPRTMPMERLGEYMTALARLLGEEANVHFSKIVEGSIALRAKVDQPALPKVRERVNAFRSGVAPADARKAYIDLDEMLRRDNAYGTLEGDTEGVVISFPGKRRPEPVVFGPFRQDGTIDGQVYRIGGKDDTKHVHIRDGSRDFSSLVANESVALRLRHHLFGGMLRFKGSGTWYRHDNGTWELKSFRILDFDELSDAPLEDTVRRLRAVPGSRLSMINDPIGQMLIDRNGGETPH